MLEIIPRLGPFIKAKGLAVIISLCCATVCSVFVFMEKTQCFLLPLSGKWTVLISYLFILL